MGETHPTNITQQCSKACVIRILLAGLGQGCPFMACHDSQYWCAQSTNIHELIINQAPVWWSNPLWDPYDGELAMLDHVRSTMIRLSPPFRWSKKSKPTRTYQWISPYFNIWRFPKMEGTPKSFISNHFNGLFPYKPIKNTSIYKPI